MGQGWDVMWLLVQRVLVGGGGEMQDVVGPSRA